MLCCVCCVALRCVVIHYVVLRCVVLRSVVLCLFCYIALRCVAIRCVADVILKRGMGNGNREWEMGTGDWGMEIVVSSNN